MGVLTHFWVAKSPLTVRSRCGAVEALRAKARQYQGPECPVCFGTGKEDPVLCAIPVGDLPPMAGFMLDAKEGGVLVGVVERVPSSRGYVTVWYCTPGGGKHHQFTDRGGDPVEFVDSGFRRSEWSAGTLVRPLLEDGMSEDQVGTLVDAPGGPAPSVASIRDKVASMKSRAAAKVGAPKGKPVGKPKAGTPAAKPAAKPAGKAKTPKEPKEQRPCLCGCGTLTSGTFAPGHDARVKGWFKKIAAGEMEFKELPKSLQKIVVDVKGVKKALTKPIKELGS